MRAHLVRAGLQAHHWTQVTSSPGCATPGAFDDATVIHSAAACGDAYLQANGVNIGDLFAKAAIGALGGAGIASAALYLTTAAAIQVFGPSFAGTLVLTAQGAAQGILGAFGIAVSLTEAVPIVGAIVGALIALITGLASLIHTCSLQITNGNSYHCDDYVNINLRNATDWLNKVTPRDLVGKRPVWMANQFDIFLANPVWMYRNQALLGISQPPPPDPGDMGGPGPIYYQMPGAFELLNRAQLAAAAQLVAATPGQLPFWKSVPFPGLIFPGPGDNWQPGGSQQGIITSWQPGQITTQLDPSNPLGGTQTSVYESCPYLTLPESANVTAGMNLLQISYPALTKTQCDQIFAAVQPAYEQTKINALTWANTQCPVPYLPDLGPGSKWNLTVEDATAIINAWTGPLDGSCISASGPKMAILQALADTMCPAPSATQVQALDKSGTLSLSDAQVIAKRWAFEGRGVCVGGHVVLPGSNSPASKVVTAAVVTAGLGALGVFAFAYAHHMTFGAAARHLGSTVVTKTNQLAHKVFPPARRLKRVR